jgi:small subunit ribosomal protein S1
MASPVENTVVRGTVKSIADDFAIVELAGAASTAPGGGPGGSAISGRVPLAEFGKPPAVTAGDAVDVLVEVHDEGAPEAQLSKVKADLLARWNAVAGAHARDELVEGTVIAAIKGGYSVELQPGVRAFLPGKHAEGKAEDLVGEKLQLKIIKLDDEDGRVVVSRRVLVQAQKKETLAKIKEGALLDGVVKTVTDYGAFIDLGGLDGLLHVTEMSWGRVGHPRELVKVGDPIRVMVLKFDAATERIGLGLKQTQEDPWAGMEEKLPAGTKVTGKVKSLTDFGAFIEVRPGVEGLIHVSELSWSKRAPSKLLKIGQEVTASVLEVDAKAKRISLSLKANEANPWMQLEQQHPIGSIVRGQVKSVTEFGVFVAVTDGVDGLVHASDISWTQRVKNPGEIYKKGDKVEAVILDIDAANERCSLGIKQLKADPWAALLERYPVGSVVKGKVVRIVDFGAFVELEPGLEGLVHVSQLREERVEKAGDVVKPGDELQVKVIDLDPREHKISLSVKAALHEDYDYRATMEKLAGEGRASFGDVLAGKLGKND